MPAKDALATTWNGNHDLEAMFAALAPGQGVSELEQFMDRDPGVDGHTQDGPGRRVGRGGAESSSTAASLTLRSILRRSRFRRIRTTSSVAAKTCSEALPRRKERRPGSGSGTASDRPKAGIKP